MKRNLFFIRQWIIGVFFSAGFLQSCDPALHYEKVLENRTDFDIRIIPIRASNRVIPPEERDTFLVAKHSEGILADFTSIGFRTESVQDCDLFISEVEHKIIGPDSLRLLIDLNDLSNWDFTILGKAGLLSDESCECRLIINKEDIK